VTDEERAAAAKRIKEKRDFRNHAATYVIVNLFMVAIWFIGGADGYFWPIWVMVPWGVGLAFHGWNVYNNPPITEEDIDRELGT
jgi:fatty acid desaturase